jgi:hypothetical protein
MLRYFLFPIVVHKPANGSSKSLLAQIFPFKAPGIRGFFARVKGTILATTIVKGGFFIEVNNLQLKRN